MKYDLKFSKNKVFTILMLAGLVIVANALFSTLGDTSNVFASPGNQEVTGWLWSDNIGWISMNCSNSGTCGTSNYKVLIDDVTGNFSGYGWSDNIGWVSFQSSDVAGCPSGSCPANVDLVSTGQVTGWAKALSAGGGWDGWISLRRTASPAYGVDMDLNTGAFSGWAWGSDVVGWVSFSDGSVACSGCVGVTPLPQCSDGADNADPEDTLVDANDPGCHTDGIASNPASYDSNDDDETDTLVSPTTPSGLTVNSDLVCQAMTLNWTDNSSNETKFEIERGGVKIGETVPNVTSYVDSGLTPGVSYSYRVRACNAIGCSGYVGPVSGVAQACPPGFSLNANPAAIYATITVGTGMDNSIPSTITVSAEAGFSENITLTLIAGAPTGATPVFSPSVLNVSQYGIGSVFRMTNIPESSVPVGETAELFNLVIRGESSITHATYDLVLPLNVELFDPGIIEI